MPDGAGQPGDGVDGLDDGQAVGCELGDGDCDVGLADGDALGLGDEVGLADGLADGLGLGLGVGDSPGSGTHRGGGPGKHSSSVGLGEGDADGEGEAEGDDDGEVDGVCEEAIWGAAATTPDADHAPIAPNTKTRMTASTALAIVRSMPSPPCPRSVSALRPTPA